MSQSARQSFVEAASNVVVGYVLALAVQSCVFPAMGLPITLVQSAQIGLIFVGVSFARSYLLRRLFNRIGRRRASPRPASSPAAITASRGVGS